jgi:uncharacterized phage infection (PIP) family protein YhgE
MPGEKRFRTSPFGFNKSDVNSYVEKMLRDFEERLKQKDDEIAMLKNQARDMKSKYEEIIQNAEQIEADRAKIADVLIKAQEQAETILEESRKQFMEEKRKLEEINEQEKEKIVDMKEKVKYIRSEIIHVLKGFEDSLSNIIEDETIEE